MTNVKKNDLVVPPVYSHGPEFETALKKILYYYFKMFPPIVSVVFENLSQIRRVFQTAFTVQRTITLLVFFLSFFLSLFLYFFLSTFLPSFLPTSASL